MENNDKTIYDYYSKAEANLKRTGRKRPQEIPVIVMVWFMAATCAVILFKTLAGLEPDAFSQAALLTSLASAVVGFFTGRVQHKDWRNSIQKEAEYLMRVDQVGKD